MGAGRHEIGPRLRVVVILQANRPAVVAIRIKSHQPPRRGAIHRALIHRALCVGRNELRPYGVGDHHNELRPYGVGDHHNFRLPTDRFRL
jgi:hypothetical protein